MSSSVREAVADAILDHGPITFAEYMERALYGPGGYYERPPVGPGGDFVTSPHVHPVFAELLARAVHDMAEALGRPAPLRLVEVGAGDGTLATGMLPHLADLDLTYTAVERSPGARAQLAGVTAVAVAEAMPTDPHVVLAHELLDNLPFRRVRVTTQGPREVRVGLDASGVLQEVLTETDDADLARTDGLAVGDEAVIPDGALAFVERLAAALTHGMALLVDYGGLGTSGGPVHGYRDHRVMHDPLDDPGEADITAGIDFAWIAERAEAGGLVPHPSVTQRRALEALGFEAWMRGELEAQHRALDERDGLGAVRTWGARSRATLLVDPAALGRLRWLVLTTPGLPPPSWLTRALAQDA